MAHTDNINTLCLSMLMAFSASFSMYAKSPIVFPNSNSASVGIYIKDLKNGKVIAENNSDILLTPASTMKVVTLAAAMNSKELAPEYSTIIKILGETNPADSTFEGVILVQPSGDPTINAEQFCDGRIEFTHFISTGLLRNGITKFRGEVIVENNDDPNQGQLPTWEIEDACYGYGAGWYSFNYRNNIFQYTPATRKACPEMPFLNFVFEPSCHPFEITHGVDSDTYTFSGKIPLSPTRTLTLPLPWPASLFFEEQLSSFRDKGIRFEDKEISDYKNLPLVEELIYYSPKRIDIYKHTMKQSDNLMAEASLRSLAPHQTLDSALTVEKQIYSTLGIDTQNMRIFDGSGLSRKNGISPRFLTSVLEMMLNHQEKESFIDLLPVAGKDGTMKSFIWKSPRGTRLAMKTGSVSGVRCYAGYLLSKDNKPLCTVVVMINNFNTSVANVKKGIEQYLSTQLRNYK